MKQYMITIDTGTTNTRAILWNEDRVMIAKASSETGVRNTAIDGNNSKLKAAVHDCIRQLLEQGECTYDDIKQIVASGMITSNVGLVEVPHMKAPAGLKELAEGCKSYVIEDVCPLPILFIPGVKNAVAKIDTDTFEGMDIMRGEEVESMAMLEDLPKDKPYLFVLPGSHTKFVSIDAQGRITGCLTTLAGELLSVITTNTLIADAVNHSFVSEETYEKDMVLLGYETATKTGIARSAFAARILNMFTDKEKTSLANYLLGAVLAGDVQAAKGSSALPVDREMTVIVSGKNPLKQAICDILKKDGYFADVREYTPDPTRPMSAIGALSIIENR